MTEEGRGVKKSSNLRDVICESPLGCIKRVFYWPSAGRRTKGAASSPLDFKIHASGIFSDFLLLYGILGSCQ